MYFPKLHQLFSGSCIVNMAEKSMTSLELRKLIVKLCNEDKLSIGDISKTVGKSKSVLHSILRKLEKTGSCEAKKPPGRPRKTTARHGLMMNKKRIDLRQQPLSLKELTLALKYQGKLFSEDLMK